MVPVSSFEIADRRIHWNDVILNNGNVRQNGSLTTSVDPPFWTSHGDALLGIYLMEMRGRKMRRTSVPLLLPVDLPFLIFFALYSNLGKFILIEKNLS